MSKNWVVITGGGADGAYSVGRITKLNKDYDGAFLVSTGALMGCHVLSKEFEALRESYMIDSTKDLIERSAFREDGSFRWTRNVIELIKSNFNNNNSLGKSDNLRAHIDKHLTKEIWEMCLSKDIYVGCHSITYSSNVMIHNKEALMSFEHFKDWIYISACAPAVMSIPKKARPRSLEVEQWTDGGLTEGCPLEFAVQTASAGDTIDVMMHHPKPLSQDEKKPHRVKSVKDSSAYFAKVLINQIGVNDLSNGLKAAFIKGCLVNVYWMDKEHYNNPFVFNKDKMQDLYDKGFENANKNIQKFDYRK